MHNSYWKRSLDQPLFGEFCPKLFWSLSTWTGFEKKHFYLVTRIGRFCLQFWSNEQKTLITTFKHSNMLIGWQAAGQDFLLITEHHENFSQLNGCFELWGCMGYEEVGFLKRQDQGAAVKDQTLQDKFAKKRVFFVFVTWITIWEDSLFLWLMAFISETLWIFFLFVCFEI